MIPAGLVKPDAVAVIVTGVVLAAVYVNVCPADVLLNVSEDGVNVPPAPSLNVTVPIYVLPLGPIGVYVKLLDGNTHTASCRACEGRCGGKVGNPVCERDL